jgi:nicotinate dehydrogenase subunit B
MTYLDEADRRAGIATNRRQFLACSVALVASFSWTASTSGEIRVTHFFVVRDCRQVVYPDGERAQLEGNIIQTVSRTLKERVAFDRSRVTSVDWASYPILTFPEVRESIWVSSTDRETMGRWRAVGRCRSG